MSEAALKLVDSDNFASKPGLPVHQSSKRSTSPVITSTDDLPDFDGKLYDEINLQFSLRHLICPVRVGKPDDAENGKKFLIFYADPGCQIDIVNETTAILNRHGYKQATNHLIKAAPLVMMDLAKDRVNSINRSAHRAQQQQSSRDSKHFQIFQSIAAFALRNNASDIHIEIDIDQLNLSQGAKTQVKQRIDGRLCSPPELLITSADLYDSMAFIYNFFAKNASETIFSPNRALQCIVPLKIDGKDLKFRWASDSSVLGWKLVMRVLLDDAKIPTLTMQELGYLDSQIETVNRNIQKLGGGIIVSGVVGSGKSTLIKTIMETGMPEHFAKYSIEDPVEYRIKGVTQFAISRDLEQQGLGPFIAKIRSLKRMDLDVLLVGEIRDRETAIVFRDVTESGHRAIASIHAPSAIDALILRLVSDEIGIPRDVLATPGVINLLIYQALLPKVCMHCSLAASEVYDAEYLHLIVQLFDIKTERIRATNPKGCPHCNRPGLTELNGTKGRIVCAEMIELDYVMLELFKAGDNLKLKSYIKGQQDSLNNRYDAPDSTGKSAMEVAVYHMAQGIIDPKKIEQQFGSFLQYKSARDKGLA